MMESVIICCSTLIWYIASSSNAVASQQLFSGFDKSNAVQLALIMTAVQVIVGSVLAVGVRLCARKNGPSKAA